MERKDYVDNNKREFTEADMFSFALDYMDKFRAKLIKNQYVDVLEADAYLSKNISAYKKDLVLVTKKNIAEGLAVIDGDGHVGVIKMFGGDLHNVLVEYTDKNGGSGIYCLDKHCKDEYEPLFLEKQKDLFGEPVPVTYFVGVPSAEDGGFMMCSCGRANGDGGANWVVTTTGLKADEIPEECTDAKTFALLVAKLLNEHYNKK